jgi:hypothetical protein
MAREYKFKSIKVKKKDAFQNVPDWDNIIELNGHYFTFTGWMEPLTANISWKLSEITDERLKADKWLKTKYVEFLGNRKK